MRKLIVISIVGLLLMGCAAEKNSDSVINEKTEQALAEANREVGLPAIVNWTEKKQLKWIYELCDQENLICHAYLFNTMTGEVGQYLGKCIGYGIPYSSQYSNPSKYTGVRTNKVVKDGARDFNWDYQIMPQAEPNGIFKPEGLSATWLIMVDKEGKLRPAYIEPEIMVFPYKLSDY